MKTCKTCKHWLQIPDERLGVCAESEGTMMNTFGRKANGAFLTGPKEKCMIWEPIQETPE